MKISYNWLKKYIDTHLSPEDISAALTSIGLEVESLEPFCSVQGGLEGFVVGEVLTCDQHPNADKLHVTTVSIGEGQPLLVVCGAPNVAAGQKVVVATIGTTIYSGKESFQIKKSKIRGEESQGMLCAEDELGLGTGHDGILILDPLVVPGTLAKDYFEVEADYVFEIGLTPNRIDAASHYGVARDLYAYLKSRGEHVTLSLPSVEDFGQTNDLRPFNVVVENAEACPRYAGLTISGVTIAPSPVWLQNRLRAIGLNPINNIVDITNFVLHELCQPLHAFDADKVADDTIIVRTLPEGTKFITLDGVDRTLSAQDLMICDTRGGMCIGGVFGGSESGISESTRNIFLESAYFNPVWIRKSARLHGLNTDASFRFERGIDPNGTLLALKRAAQLICDIAGGVVSSPVYDVCADSFPPFRIALNIVRIQQLIGKEIPADTIKTILRALDITIEREDGDHLSVLVPPYRVDVQREADIVEEVLRIYSYNQVEISDEVHSTLSHTPKPDKAKVTNTIADYLSSNGFNEIMSNSLTKVGYYEDNESFRMEHLVKVLNPLSQDLGCLRQTLLYGGLEAIAYNTNRKNADLKLYEFGNCYRTGETLPSQALVGYTEQQHLALFLTGSKTEVIWNAPEEPTGFFTAKSYAENILRRVGIDPESLVVSGVSCDTLSEGIRYTKGDITLAVVGIVSKKTLQKFDIKAPVFFADLNWTEVLRAVRKNRIVFSSLPRFPEVKRDLALLIDQNVTFGQILHTARQAERKLLKKVTLFDVYEGNKLPEGKKSYAVSFILQDAEKTLTDKQIDQTMQRLIQAFEKETGARIRQ